MPLTDAAPTSPTPPEVLAAFAAASARSRAVPRDLRWLASVTSTMDVAEEWSRAGTHDAFVIVADEQTRGRGRRGRAWSSPPGAGLYLSFVWHSHGEAVDGGGRSLLTLAAGVAVRLAIARAAGLAAELKWPNDLMVGRRKLAGILAEGLGVGTGEESVILGIGINVFTASHRVDVATRATSLQDELGRTIDRARVLEEVLVAVSDARDSLCKGNTNDILHEWRAAAPLAEGAAVEWVTHHGRHRGTTAGIDDTGALLVRSAAGLERIVGGEVTWL
jgi:BirA family biotin operon repressor/biotin-[acetyl-CoA-carboxylase] ligase